MPGAQRPKESADTDARYRGWRKAREEGIAYSPLVTAFGAGVAAIFTNPSKFAATLMLIGGTAVSGLVQWRDRRKNKS